MRADASLSPFDADLDYLHRLHPAPDRVTDELEARGHEKEIPIVDRATGRLLSVLATALPARSILEIGTAYGFSTLWLAKGQPADGRIITIDPDVERTTIARSFWDRAGVGERITVINEPALGALPKLAGRQFDLVFIDALKEEYPDYLQAALPLLRVGGLVLVDNLLWHHRAAQPPASDDPLTTQTIRRFNEQFVTLPQLNATIIPVGDGVGVGVKIH